MTRIQPAPSTHPAADARRLAWPMLLCLLGACSMQSAESPARTVASGAEEPTSVNLRLAKTCRVFAVAPGPGPVDPCALTQGDCDVLEEIDESNDKAFEQRLDPGVAARWMGQLLMPMGMAASGWGIKPVCDQPECRIPVVVTPASASAKRCQALLPYLRYCVRPLASPPGEKPQKLVFYLARENGLGGLVALTPQDKFEFVPRMKGPPPYQKDDVVGVDLHEDVGPLSRRPLAKPYFDPAVGLSADGLTFTWQVTAKTVNTAGSIGRIHDGVLSAAFVRPKGSTDVNAVCRPRDPIIVNTAN